MNERAEGAPDAEMGLLPRLHGQSRAVDTPIIHAGGGSPRVHLCLDVHQRVSDESLGVENGRAEGIFVQEQCCK